jgi:signal peptidase I
MNPFITRDQVHYRRWLNVLPCFAIPGSVQFLSGRRKAGVVWFLISLLLAVVTVGLLVSPHSTYTVDECHWFDGVIWAFQFALMLDACRRPMPRLGFKGWAVFCGLFLLVLVAPIYLIKKILVQPFTVPTVAMQPTLYGSIVRAPSAADGHAMHSVNTSPGEEYVEVRARVAGQVDDRHMFQDDVEVVHVAGSPHLIRRGLTLFFAPGDKLVKGQLMAAGFVKQCDHILVNRAAYWFKEPRRGDIVVFSTDGLKSPMINRHTYFVKRIVGLPDETIALQPPWILANGARLSEPPILRKIAEGRDGYCGYSFAMSSSLLAAPDDHITLGSDEYLVFGDNTRSSLDSRYFGPIRRSSIVGKVVVIYSPADRKRIVE